MTSSLAGGQRRALALGGLTLATFAYVTVETLPIGLLAPMAHDLRVSNSAIGLLVTSYALVVVIASLPLTHVTRSLPRRPLLTVLLGVFVLTGLATALAGSWTTLLVARVVAAASQALFWSIVVPVAAGLFPAAVRGRVIAVVLSGSSLAAVAGVPLGTWIGQQVGWRWAFAATAVIGVVVLAAVALIPDEVADTASARGSAPDARRFWVLVFVIALATTGAFAFFTYVSPFLADAARISAGALGVVLLLRGLAGFAGVTTAGVLTDRRPRLAVAVPVVAQVVALVALFALPRVVPLVVVAVAVTGFTFAAFTAPMGARAMTMAPGRVELATSAISTAVNVGIMFGALLGAAVIGVWDVRVVALVGAALSAVAAIALIWDRPSGRSGPEVVERGDGDANRRGDRRGDGGRDGSLDDLERGESLVGEEAACRR